MTPSPASRMAALSLTCAQALARQTTASASNPVERPAPAGDAFRRIAKSYVKPIEQLQADHDFDGRAAGPHAAAGRRLTAAGGTRGDAAVDGALARANGAGDTAQPRIASAAGTAGDPLFAALGASLSVRGGAAIAVRARVTGEPAGAAVPGDPTAASADTPGAAVPGDPAAASADTPGAAVPGDPTATSADTPGTVIAGDPAATSGTEAPASRASGAGA